MAGFFKGVANFLIGARDDYDDDENEDYNDGYDDGDYEEDYERQTYAEIQDISPRRARTRGSSGYSSSSGRSGYYSNVVNLHQKKTEINICAPKNIEESRDVIEKTRDSVISVVNLEGVDNPVAQRIADFLSGSVDALDGTMRQLSNEMFIIAPSGVDVSGDISDIHARLRSSSSVSLLASSYS